MANTGRVTQSALEFITTSAGNARVTQSVLEFIVAGFDPVPNCNNPPSGILGFPYTHSFGLTGGTAPFTWSVSAGTLPPGLSLNPSLGIVSGLPTQTGTFTFTIEVTDATPRTGTVTCSITIAALNLPITFRGVKRYSWEKCQL